MSERGGVGGGVSERGGVGVGGGVSERGGVYDRVGAGDGDRVGALIRSVHPRLG